MGRKVGVLGAALLAFCAFTPLAAGSNSASPVDQRLAPAPYMGVDTWYGFGAEIDEPTVVQLADAMVRRGLKAAGYRYLWIDAGWWHGARDAKGNIKVDPRQWPHGMRWLASYIHSKGLLAGIYTDAGARGCLTGGSYGHYQADIDRFAAWGFDALKADFCGGNAMHLDARSAFTEIGQAILHDRPHRRLLFNICNGVLPAEYGPGDPPVANSAYASYRFAPAIATSWRTGPDVGVPGQVEFGHVLRNLDLDARHPGVAGHGHWNDPDYIVPGEGMTPRQFRAQFTMWAIVAAPLVVSADIHTLPAATIATMRNREAIAISQDPLGVQGRRAAREGAADLWVKPLTGHQRAVAFLNRGPLPVRVYATSRMIGIGGHPLLAIRDVWRHRTLPFARRIAATVPPSGALLLRVSPAAT